MIPLHLYQIYPASSGPDDYTPPKCEELSEYTDSAHTEVEDLSSRYMNGYMNGSAVYGRCRHDTRQFHPSCTACRFANLPECRLFATTPLQSSCQVERI